MCTILSCFFCNMSLVHRKLWQLVKQAIHTLNIPFCSRCWIGPKRESEKRSISLRVVVIAVVFIEGLGSVFWVLLPHTGITRNYIAKIWKAKSSEKSKVKVCESHAFCNSFLWYLQFNHISSTLNCNTATLTVFALVNLCF